MDRFFTVKNCDRCNNSLSRGRIMSMYNEDVLCLDCKEKEMQRKDYEKALQADREQIKAGNYNYKGIGYKE
jgi:hypothetical protein